MKLTQQQLEAHLWGAATPTPTSWARPASSNASPPGCIYPDITKRLVFRTEGENTVLPAFAVLAWNHPIVHNQILRRAKTSNGTLKINNRDVKQIIVPVPPSGEQVNLVKLTAAADARIAASGRKLAALAQLKQSLMHDLLTGRVRVKATRLSG